MIGVQIGAYRVLRQIGAGGMGAVWLAEHMMLGRQVAIKVLHREASVRPELVTRFFNEAKAATAISDPGIVQIFDFGQHSDGNAYIVMELLSGEPLDQRLGRMGRLALGPSLRILRQVAASLGAAHQRGIVHRDLKPENIFLVRDPEVAGGERTKVLDFGIAKIDSDGAIKTHTKAVMGTPTFMSPEQCKGAGQVDQRSDVYSLGCVLFTLLAGRPPFEGDGPGDVIAMHLREPPPAPSTMVPGLPPAIDALVLRCLAKDRAQRFSSGTELALVIERLLADPVLQPFLVDLPAKGARAPSVSEELMAVPSRELPATAPPAVIVAAPSVPRVTPVSPTLVPPASAALAHLPPVDRSRSSAQQPAIDEQTTSAFAPVRPFTEPESSGAGHRAVQPYAAPLTTLSPSVAESPVRRRATRWWMVAAALLVVAGGALAIGIAAAPSESSEEHSGANGLAVVDAALPGDGPDAAVATLGDDAGSGDSAALASDAGPAVAVDANSEVAAAPVVVDAGPAPEVPTAPVVVDAGPAPGDEGASLRSQAYAGMRVLLHAFESWSKGREEVVGACPDVAALGVEIEADVARHLHLTCEDQPKGHRIGVVWDGPDGVTRTSDDVKSWQVAASLVSPVVGARWGAPKVAPPRPPRRPKPTNTQFVDKDGDGIPDVR